MMRGGTMPQQPLPGPFTPSYGGGMGLDMGFPLRMPVLTPRYTREDIVEMTNQHERDTEALRTRMEEDFGRYRLTTHTIKHPATGQVLKNYAVYTSSAPRTYADKVISWQTMAELLLRVPHLEAGNHDEEADNLKERFAIGCLRAADERLKRMLQPSLRGQTSFFTAVRGGYIGGRCLLVKNPQTGATYPDITPWDPMHIHWCIGADGLEWVCYKIKETRGQIEREYGVDIGGGGLLSRIGSYLRGSSDAEKEGIEVYDFYDGVMNTVVTDGETLKLPTPHGSPRVPAYLVLVGPVPLLQSSTATNLAAEVGESVYAGAREVYEKYSDVMSIFLEIVERARRQTVVAESRDGKKTLPEDPFVYPTTISTATGDKLYTLELQKMAQETMAYVTQILGEIQRATLPFSSYGETPFQLSGFAITQLRQATETVLASRIEAQETMYLQISNLLYDQFMTGAYDGVKLSGRDSGRNYFNQMITPDMLRNTCDYTVQLVSQLPQDDMSRWATAQIAKNMGIMSDADILDEILKVQDSKQMLDRLEAQMADRALPETTLLTLMYALASRSTGPDDEYSQKAKMILAELQRVMAVKLGVMPPSPTDQGGGQGGQRPGPQGGGGQRPEVLPRAATGAPPAPETSNQGPSFVAPNTPRPGARETLGG